MSGWVRDGANNGKSEAPVKNIEVARSLLASTNSINSTDFNKPLLSRIKHYGRIARRRNDGGYGREVSKHKELNGESEGC